ncbi:hypothetical protein CEE45_10140 [Candidatus Heimdallarchaeota archaeon B3_Heim]|nr:MAG: hypothetical protein CEE45_10140 [Candidatus Heimdallarchaeota archaeon B3_Heim]
MRKRGFVFICSIILLINIGSVKANQISIIGGATTTTSSQQSVFIPVGDYHVFINASGYLGSSVAYCTASNSTTTLFTWTTSDSVDSWTGQITFSSSNTINFTFEIQTIYTTSYEMTFQIILTDLDVATITKTGIVADATWGIEFIGLALICVSLVLLRKRRL